MAKRFHKSYGYTLFKRQHCHFSIFQMSSCWLLYARHEDEDIGYFLARLNSSGIDENPNQPYPGRVRNEERPDQFFFVGAMLKLYKHKFYTDTCKAWSLEKGVGICYVDSMAEKAMMNVKMVKKVKKMRKEKKLTYREIAKLLSDEKHKYDVKQIYRWDKYEIELSPTSC